MPDQPDLEKSFREQYELEEEAPEQEQVPSSAVAKEEGDAANPSPPPAPEKPTPPRDPETGKFVKAPPTPAHSPRLIRRAKELGFSEEEINATPTEDLRDEVLALELEKRWTSRVVTTDAAMQREEGANPAPPPPSPPEDELQISEEIHEDVAKILKAQAKEIKALREQISGLSQREQQRAAETVYEKIDRKFAEKPDLFGQGDRTKIKKGSPEHIRRMAVLNAMDQLPKGPYSDDKFEQALEIVYPQVKQPKQPKKPVEETPEHNGEAPERITPEQWEAATLSRPTHRNGSAEPDGRSKAIKTVAQWQRENAKASEEPGSIADEFPV